jgi:sterol desaturase/sphingolipid hydroxylase (fatty acid hydroxylase superfamily)
VAVLPWDASFRLIADSGLPRIVQVGAAVVLLDFFSGYASHRLMHALPWLWRFHRVHHSDAFIDVTSTYRTHPVESAWRFLFVATPAWALGVPAEGVMVYRVLSALNAIFEHANVRVHRRIDGLLSRAWVTPNTHKIHHSRDPRETDTNYGNILAIFDRILGTFTASERAFTVTYGLEDAASEARAGIGALLASPFRILAPGASSPRAFPPRTAITD